MKNLKCLFANIDRNNNTEFLNKEDYLKNVVSVEKEIIECIFNKNDFIKENFVEHLGVFENKYLSMLVSSNFIEISVTSNTGIRYKSVDALSYDQIESFIETFDERKFNLIKEDVNNLKFLLN